MTDLQIFLIVSYIIAGLYNLLFYLFIFKQNKYIDVDVALINKILGIILPGVNLFVCIFFVYYHLRMLLDNDNNGYMRISEITYKHTPNPPGVWVEDITENCEHDFITKFGVSECQNCGTDEFSDDENTDDIYCKLCMACGEDVCCPPTMCKMKKDGLYCEHYLDLLNDNYRFMLFFAENYTGLYNKVYDEFNNHDI